MDTFYGWRPVPCRPQRTRRTGEIFSEPGRYTSPDGDPADEQPTETYSHGLSLFAAPSLTGSGSPVVGSTPTGTPLFAASLETPKSPLTDSDYMMLLGSSKLPNSLVPQHLERWLRKALRDNQAAYEQWKRIARGQGPATEALHTARTIEDACTVLLSWPETLMDMLHAVPYVPVVFARIPGFLHQLGYELLILGRTAHLREIINDSSTPAAAVQLASPWLAAIEATVSRSDCWRLANSATRWGRLKKKMKNASALPRSLARVSDTEWGELLAHMMVHHSSLPPTLRVQPVATRCKHLLCRTVTPANADTVRAGVSVHQRWLDLPFGTVPGTSSGVHAAVCTVALASPGGGDGRLPQLKALRCLSRQIRESLAAPPVASTSRALRGTAADQWR